MRMGFVWIIAIMLMCGTLPSSTRAEREQQPGQAPVATKVPPGLVEDILEPFFEDEAFPLEKLIAVHPDTKLSTNRGRCLSLHVFGSDLTAQCERRLADSFPDDKSLIHWFGLGHNAIGFGTLLPVEYPKAGNLRHFVNKIYRIQNGNLSTEFAMGTCSIGEFYLRCQSIGKSGWVEADFAMVSGIRTDQYPLADAFFRYKNAKVFMAPGQCVRFLHPENGDITPFCASFAGRTLVDGEAAITIFSRDSGTTYAFYGLTSAATAGPNGTTVTPITYLILNQKGRTGTTPVVGTCEESSATNGRRNIDCKATSVRQGGTFEVSFETSGPWRETKPLSWQATGGEPSTSCKACPRILATPNPAK